ncbi:hypothetical protein FB451DRAFT_1170580 [Mycena latifolia]|nr:hypothetical protein FB451DRAFT_1170580 [Mycena latifolia]
MRRNDTPHPADGSAANGEIDATGLNLGNNPAPGSNRPALGTAAGAAVNPTGSTGSAQGANITGPVQGGGNPGPVQGQPAGNSGAVQGQQALPGGNPVPEPNATVNPNPNPNPNPHPPFGPAQLTLEQARTEIARLSSLLTNSRNTAGPETLTHCSRTPTRSRRPRLWRAKSPRSRYPL